MGKGFYLALRCVGFDTQYADCDGADDAKGNFRIFAALQRGVGEREKECIAARVLSVAVGDLGKVGHLFNAGRN